MAGGKITLTRTGNGYLNGQILWESVSNGTLENTSTVTATLQLQRGAQNTTAGTFKGSFAVGGTSQNISQFMELPSNTWVTVKTVTVTVSHNANGVGSCYLYAKIDGPSGTTMAGTSVSGSETVDLDEIARFATILSATDFTDEENPTITYSNPAGSATTKLQACISVTGEDDDIAFRDIPISGKSYTFQLTTAERDVLRSAAANSNTLALKFVVRSTVSGVEGKNNTKATMTVVNANPTATFSVVDTNSATTALTGNSSNFIALHSTPKVTLTVATKKSATIPNKGVEISDGVTVWKKNGSFEGTISPLSSGDINYKVTDSRGNMIGGGVKRTFIAYFNPTIQIDSITRDGSGNLTIVASGEAFDGSFGRSNNARTVYYQYKKGGDSDYSTWSAFSSSDVVWNGNQFTATKRISSLDYTKSYDVRVSITDSLHTGDNRVIARKTGLSTIPIFDWGENDFCFNVPVAMAKNGFGVPGNQVPVLADANNAVSTGWYRIDSTTTNSLGAAAIMRVDSTSDQNVVQTAYSGSFSADGYTIKQRHKRNGTWSSWKWVNPPLMVGTEYPTTELYLGKTVYIKVVNFGALPASKNKNVTYSTAAATPIYLQLLLSDDCVLGAGYGRDRSFSTTSGLFLDATQYSIRVYTEADFSSLTAYAVVKYVKKA